MNLTLTLHDKTDGHTLHTTCRKGGLNLTPKHRRELETYQTVQYTAGLLGIHQVHIQMTGLLDGLQDGWLGYFVEDNAVRILFVQSQHLAQVP